MQSTSDLFRFFSLALAFLAIAGLVIAFTAGRNCSRSASEADIADEIRDIPPTFELKARDFVEAYLADEEASASTYNGEVGIITGIEATSSIGDLRDPPRDQSNSVYFFTNGVWFVRCFMSHDEKAAFRKDHGGGYFRRPFSLKGRVEGINNKHLTIDLHGCIVLF